MKGIWRGFVVKNSGVDHFPLGEIDAHFYNNTVEFSSQDGTINRYNVSTIASDSFSLREKDSGKIKNWVNSIVGDLKFTRIMGLSTFENTTYPESFAEGIKSNNTVNAVFFQCN